MFNAEITKVSFMDFSHVITQHRESPKWWYLVTDFATVLQQELVGLLDVLTAEPDLVLPLK